jgi:2-keto-4-pentenoate hydratase/2-oxohepta-3-ene-1,7-dioic acid hydratase in catechol pathway
MLELLDMGDPGMDAVRRLAEWVAQQDEACYHKLVSTGAVFEHGDPSLRLVAPVPRPGKVLAIGLNYRAHAAESGAEIPQYPIVFAKATTSIIGPETRIVIPAVSERVDWEGELCVVIGRRARRVPRERALDYIAGYMNGNDVSVRDWQRHAATWMMGKSFDTHGPTGPWLVTRDDIPDPSGLRLRVWVNEVLKQESSIDDLIFGIPELIEYISTGCTLEPGDVIFTGTPSGVGSARRPQEWLRPGDTVRVAIDHLGELRSPVAAESAEP